MYNTDKSGTLLGGRYRILRQLGAGGFGKTYLAEDVNRFQELCVLKEFNPHVEDRLALEKAQTLFEREASILYQLDHPQIPKFRELLREEGRLVLVQDYIEGPTYGELLDRRRQQEGHFLEADVLGLLAQLLPVLQYLHSVGIVHRDISPDNLIQRNSDGRPVLIDFGGVKQLVVNVRYQLGDPHPYQENEGQVTRLGKLGYAPAEQMDSGVVSPSTDLYALGVTAIVLLTGKHPEDLFDDRHKQWHWHEETGDLSPSLQAVLDRMVAPNPPDRFPSAGEVMAALNVVRPAEGTSTWNQSMPVRMQPLAPPPPSPPPRPTQQRTVAVARPAPPPTQVQAPSPSPYTRQTSPPANSPSPRQRPAPTRPATRRTSAGCWPALAGLLLVGGVATGLWIWLDPLDQLGDGSGGVSPQGNDSQNPAFSQEEQIRKQTIRDRALELGIDRAYLTRLTDQFFFEQNPSLQGTQLTDQPQDAELRAEWDAIAAANLNLLETNLSPESRGKLGRYNPADRDRWQRQVNDLYVSSKALYDLADARFQHLFPDRRREGFVETPIDQVWFALAQDELAALQSGERLTETRFQAGAFNQQVEGTLQPGAGQVYLLNLAQGQLMRLNLQAPPNSTLLSFYVPSPNADLPHLLADTQQTTWAGELPQSGYYEIVIVSTADGPITYSLNAAVDNVEEGRINRPDPPKKKNN
jgi:serine/threonine-protein kinase